MRAKAVVRLCSAGIALALAGSRVGLAADPAPSPPGQTSPDAAVTAQYNAGMTAAKAGQWEKAREAFLQAWKLKPHFQIAGNLGRAELMTGRYRDAAEHMRYSLREAPAKLSAAEREKAQRMLADAQAKIGTVTVEVDVEGAGVTVDGAAIGRSPIAEPVFVEPGKRVFEAKREGYGPGRMAMEVSAGSTPKVTLHLLHVTPPAPQQTVPPATPASREVKTAQPMQSAATPASQAVHTAQPMPPSATPASQDNAGMPRWKPWAIGGGAALAAVGLGVGIGFTVASNAKGSEAIDLQGQLRLATSSDMPICEGSSPPENKAACDTFSGALHDRDSYRTGAVVGYALGGAAAVGTIALLVWPTQPRGRSTAVRVRPILSSGQGGVVIHGAF